jgi:hypothetical protein
MQSTLELPVLVTICHQIPTQLSSEQEEDLNYWYDAQEREWVQQQEYIHDNYLYADRI